MAMDSVRGLTCLPSTIDIVIASLFQLIAWLFSSSSVVFVAVAAAAVVAAAAAAVVVASAVVNDRSV